MVLSCIEYFDKLWRLAQEDINQERVKKCETALYNALDKELPRLPRGLLDYGTKANAINEDVVSTLSERAITYLEQTQKHKGAEAVREHYCKLLELTSDLDSVTIDKPDKNDYVVHRNENRLSNFLEFKAARSRKTGQYRYAMRLSNHGSYHDPEGLLCEASPNYGHLRQAFDFDENTDLEYAARLLRSSYQSV